MIRLLRQTHVDNNEVRLDSDIVELRLEVRGMLLHSLCFDD